MMIDLETRKREAIRAFWTDDEQREHDADGCAPERVIELVLLGNQRRREQVARLCFEQGLDYRQHHHRIESELIAVWRMQCDEAAGEPTATAPAGQA